MYITTEQLQNRLAHCYGKDTVTVTHYNGNNFIFHYNALICVINDQRVIFNIPYYDYSGATSRVRNRACEMILGKSWTTPQLHRHEYGYVNSKGIVVVDYIYDDAKEQNEYGYLAVKKDGVWGSIDKEGKTVIEPTYNLDNNLVIDFIGKWHLGQDLNMNYYCDK